MGDGFAWTIPLIQTGVGILFLAARRAGAAPEAGAWGVAFLLTAAAFAVPALEPVVPIELVAVSADTFFALAFFTYADALFRRYGRGAGPRVRLAVLALSVAAPVSGVLVLGSLQAELIASDVTCALQLVLVLAFLPLWPKGWIDRGLIGLSWVNVADNLLRTASTPFTLDGATFSSFLVTEYGYLMQATALVTGLAFAMLALVAVCAELIAGHRREAFVDPLTGLLNRRGLEAMAGEGSPGRPDSIVVCDLDHFKRVNDRWGHAVGDRVLVALADLIRGVLPPSGIAARMGGEEFVLHLPDHSLSRAEAVALRLRAAMSDHDWTAQGIQGGQTASFGLGLRLGGDAETLGDAIRRADAKLYEAKRSGRDQIRGALAA